MNTNEGPRSSQKQRLGREFYTQNKGFVGLGESPVKGAALPPLMDQPGAGGIYSLGSTGGTTRPGTGATQQFGGMTPTSMTASPVASKARWMTEELGSASPPHSAGNRSARPGQPAAALEESLIEKAMFSLEGRPGDPTAVPQMFIREVVSTTVADIVGILESLVDRLLMTKKHGTIQNMVAQLLTEHVGRTVAEGAREMAKTEVAHLTEGHQQLTENLIRAQRSWEKKFLLTHELKEHLAGQQSQIVAQGEDLESRIEKVNSELMPRAELDARFQKMQKELHELRNEISVNLRKEMRAELEEKVSVLQQNSDETYATKVMLDKVESTLSSNHSKLKVETEEQFSSIASTYATKDEIKDHADTHAERLTEIHEKHDEHHKHFHVLKVGFESHKSDAQDSFAKADDLSRLESTLLKIVKDLESKTVGKVQQLREECATSAEVKTELNNANRERSLSNQQQDQLRKEAEVLHIRLRDLQTFCQESLSKKQEVETVAALVTAQKERIAFLAEDNKRLHAELEAERQRIRSCFRQQQNNRSDLNQLIEKHEELASVREDFEHFKSAADDVQERLDKREEAHWHELRAEQLTLRQNSSRLNRDVKEVGEDLVKMQKTRLQEEEIQKTAVSSKFIEQMDKAFQVADQIKNAHSKIEVLSDHVHTLQRRQDASALAG
jgi:chromosome segregation ATPase